ncbi:MAG: TerC family protein [Planctomycetota bacterium]|nr:TerC family protein [Planctomycetota bacterium]
MEWLTFENSSDLLVLCLMEIVLGIDNIVFIAIVTSRLPQQQRSKARKIGLLLALGMRILLLSTINIIANLEEAVFKLTQLGIPEGWLPAEAEEFALVNGISWRDIVLLVGGLFLITKSVLEIHEQFNETHQENGKQKEATFTSVLIQIAILDIVFSLDSVIAAIGLADQLWVMITAIIIAVGAMILFANTISEFVEANPTLKMLALSFLILIGMMLVVEGSGAHINKGYIYFAMAFSLVVEFLNIALRNRSRENRSQPASQEGEAPEAGEDAAQETVPTNRD